MGLRETAEADLGVILEDTAIGGGWPITITDPAGNVGALTGMSGDISAVIDPDTGVAVSGRLAHISVRISSLYSAGLALPQGIADAGSLPWVVAFDDINGESYTFKVAESQPDRGLGIVTCLLETYAV